MRRVSARGQSPPTVAALPRSMCRSAISATGALVNMDLMGGNAAPAVSEMRRTYSRNPPPWGLGAPFCRRSVRPPRVFLPARGYSPAGFGRRGLFLQFIRSAILPCPARRSLMRAYMKVLLSRATVLSKAFLIEQRQAGGIVWPPSPPASLRWRHEKAART